MRIHDSGPEGSMSIDVLEDYLEAADPELRAHIRQSMEDYRAGRTRPLRDVLEELKAEEPK
jgi:hypothetical protein